MFDPLGNNTEHKNLLLKIGKKGPRYGMFEIGANFMHPNSQVCGLKKCYKNVHDGIIETGAVWFFGEKSLF